VAGAAVAAGVSYYLTSSALAALAEERALRREEAEPRGGSGTPHARKGKHASFSSAPNGGTPGKHKHHHERASEQARRAVASAAELASRVGASDGEDEGAYNEVDDAAEEDANGVSDVAAPAGVLSNLEYAQRVLADDALPSRAATRFTVALGQTPETPHTGGNGNSYGVYGDEGASADEEEMDVSEAASGMETGLETEEERSGALRRRRRDDAAAAGGRLLACKTGRAADDGAASSDAPMPLMPQARHSPKRASTKEMPEIASWTLGPSVAPPPPANLLAGMPQAASRTASGVSTATASAPSARPSSAFRVRDTYVCVVFCAQPACFPALRCVA
jgi:hypothetical protein